MKTINYWRVLLVTLFIGMAFVSCSDDDNEDNGVSITAKNVIGVWKHLGEYGWEDGEYFKNFEDESDKDGYRLQYRVINEDGTYIRYSAEVEGDDFYWDSKETGSWSFDQKTITFFNDRSLYSHDVRKVIKLTSNSMELKSQEKEWGYEVDVYKRVSNSVLDKIPDNYK